MFIDSFRGLGTNLVEGCAGDFLPNAAECNRVHPSVRQRASGACQSASGRAMLTDHPMTTIYRLSRQILATNRPNLASDPPDTLWSAEIDILTRFQCCF